MSRPPWYSFDVNVEAYQRHAPEVSKLILTRFKGIHKVTARRIVAITRNTKDGIDTLTICLSA